MSVSEAITEAIQSARYNEAVILSDASQKGSEVILVATLDEENGGIVWNTPVDNDGDGDDAGIVRHLRTKRWVLPMLHDAPRNELYESAIRNACQLALRNRSASENSDTDTANEDTLHVLDIGSGTGLLAMMAAKYGKEALEFHINNKDMHHDTNDEADKSTSDTCPVTVTSVEMASAMARLARLTIASNNLEDIITVSEVHSTDPCFVVPEKAHVCTSELLESGLLGEGMLPAIRDAWDRHLSKEAIVVPQKARVFAQLIEGHNCIANYCGPRVVDWQGDDLKIHLSTSPDPNNVLLGTGSDDFCRQGGIQVPIHVEAILDPSFSSNDLFPQKKAQDMARVLTEPVEVLDFDFTSRDAIPSSKGRSRSTTVRAISSGMAHGVLFWWELDLFGNNETNQSASNNSSTYSTESRKLPWQDHWLQCLYVFSPHPSEPISTIEKGVSYNLIASHNDSKISFMLEPVPDPSCHAPPKRQKTGAENPDRLYKSLSNDNGDDSMNRHISPERAYQLNDRDHLLLIQKAIVTAMEVKGQHAPVLDLSDFSLCAILAATAGDATRVTSLESSTGSMPMLSARVSQLGNGLPRQRVESSDQHAETPQFQIINAYAENLTLDMVLGEQVQVVMAEPYYETLEGWHLQEALNYFYLIRALKRRGIISPMALSVPAYASVMMCAVQLDDIALAYTGIKPQTKKGDNSARICGFCHNDVNKYGDRYHGYDVSFPLWQYRYKQLTNSKEVARIQYEGDMQIQGNNSWVSTKFTQAGTCHGMVVWIDYGMRIGEDTQTLPSFHSEKETADFQTMSTMTRSHRQMVRLLQAPRKILADDVHGFEFRVMTKIGNCQLGEDHNFDINIQAISSL